MATADQLLRLSVQGESFGIKANLVREVMRMPRLARVPHAPPALLGLANVRGSVVPVVSLAQLVERTAGGERRIVVIDVGEPVGLAVDGVARLMRADDAAEASVQAVDAAALIAKAVTATPARPALAAITVETDYTESADARGVPLVTFAVSGQEFALPLGAVEEVLRLPAEIAILPHSGDAIVGSAAVRGALLPLLSLRALLALPDGGGGSAAQVLVARIGSHRVGLVVDTVRSVLRVPEEDVDPIPQVLTRGGAETRIQAICRIDGGKSLVSILSAEHLLREDITARLLQDTSGDDQIMAESAATASEQFLLFRIGDDEFGLPIAAVEEVAPLLSKLARLPNAPAFVRGVMNVRGAVVPVIDQAERFGGVPSQGRKRRVVIVRLGALQAGFVVDAVSEVLRIDEDALRPLPDLGRNGARVFERVANLPDQQRLVLIVSPRELLDRAEQDLLHGVLDKGSAAPS
ncbi:chemotaxis protein CheW [Altericroceibacterium xinjiangense]|uniref:chemotaxis protein CheW n=1 Tax=Altericroceibacterium xinjiangense TaxID=762261 RepID=UPI000F7E5A47|nr:chemotaxis protein CheW [Altericroceibacterium xinjiangense]